MKRINLKTIGLGLILGMGLASVSYAEGPFADFSRQAVHPAEAYGYFHTMDGTTTFPGGYYSGPSEVDDSGWVGGVGFGVNLSDYINVSTEFGFGNLETTYGYSDTMNDTFVFEWKVGVDYNILKKRLTPVITAGVGFMNQSVEETDYSEFVLTYGGGGGLRYDITDRLFAKAIYRYDGTSFEGSSELTWYHGFWVSVGYKF